MGFLVVGATQEVVEVEVVMGAVEQVDLKEVVTASSALWPQAVVDFQVVVGLQGAARVEAQAAQWHFLLELVLVLMILRLAGVALMQVVGMEAVKEVVTGGVEKGVVKMGVVQVKEVVMAGLRKGEVRVVQVKEVVMAGVRKGVAAVVGMGVEEIQVLVVRLTTVGVGMGVGAVVVGAEKEVDWGMVVVSSSAHWRQGVVGSQVVVVTQGAMGVEAQTAH